MIVVFAVGIGVLPSIRVGPSRPSKTRQRMGTTIVSANPALVIKLGILQRRRRISDVLWVQYDARAARFHHEHGSVLSFCRPAQTRRNFFCTTAQSQQPRGRELIIVSLTMACNKSAGTPRAQDSYADPHAFRCTRCLEQALISSPLSPKCFLPEPAANSAEKIPRIVQRTTTAALFTRTAVAIHVHFARGAGLGGRAAEPV